MTVITFNTFKCAGMLALAISPMVTALDKMEKNVGTLLQEEQQQVGQNQLLKDPLELVKGDNRYQRNLFPQNLRSNHVKEADGSNYWKEQIFEKRGLTSSRHKYNARETQRPPPLEIVIDGVPASGNREFDVNNIRKNLGLSESKEVRLQYEEGQGSQFGGESSNFGSFEGDGRRKVNLKGRMKEREKLMEIEREREMKRNFEKNKMKRKQRKQTSSSPSDPFPTIPEEEGLGDSIKSAGKVRMVQPRVVFRGNINHRNPASTNQN